MKEIELTQFLENLMLESINKKNKASQELELYLKILFESKGIEMPKNGNIQIVNGKLLYNEGLN